MNRDANTNRAKTPRHFDEGVEVFHREFGVGRIKVDVRTGAKYPTFDNGTIGTSYTRVWANDNRPVSDACATCGAAAEYVNEATDATAEHLTCAAHVNDGYRPIARQTVEVTVCGPNLRDQSKGSFHVHAAGCADLARGARREPEYAHGWTLKVASRTAVCDAVYPPEDFACESGEYLSDLHFFPCCADLPG
jgi:hypothetical protein